MAGMRKARMATSSTIAMMILFGSICCFSLSSSVAGVESSDIVSQINDYREMNGLSALRLDTVTSSLMAGWLQETIQARATTPVGLRPEDVAHIEYISDWESRVVLLNSSSLSDLLVTIVEDDNGKEAFLYPLATHVAIATASLEDDQLLALISISRKLVKLGPFIARVLPAGTTLIVQGETSFRYLRLRFYQGTDDPRQYFGPDYVQEALPDSQGRFREALPISYFGTGPCRILVYVRNDPAQDYEIAAQTYFNVTEEVGR